MTDQVAADFLPDELPANPMEIVGQWLDAARNARNQPNPNAMPLATQDTDGTLSARIVLCKRFDAEAGTIDFFTNYRSRKSRALTAHNQVALVFHWDHQGRQVRIQGKAAALDATSNDTYFATRPRLSQMGAWASDQSEPIEGRAAHRKQCANRHAAHGEREIPRPEHGGGNRITAEYCELWVEGSGRVHDRARFLRSIDSEPVTPWRGQRLQP